MLYVLARTYVQYVRAAGEAAGREIARLGVLFSLVGLRTCRDEKRLTLLVVAQRVVGEWCPVLVRSKTLRSTTRACLSTSRWRPLLQLTLLRRIFDSQRDRSYFLFLSLETRTGVLFVVPTELSSGPAAAATTQDKRGDTCPLAWAARSNSTRDRHNENTNKVAIWIHMTRKLTYQGSYVECYPD